MRDVPIDGDCIRNVQEFPDFSPISVVHEPTSQQRYDLDSSAQSDLREGNLLLRCLSCLNHEAMGLVNHRRWYSSNFGQGLFSTIPVFE